MKIENKNAPSYRMEHFRRKLETYDTCSFFWKTYGSKYKGLAIQRITRYKPAIFAKSLLWINIFLLLFAVAFAFGFDPFIIHIF